MDAGAIEHLFSDNGVILDEKLVGECMVFKIQFSPKSQLLTGASICRMYGVSAEDLLWKIQSINFTSSGPRTELRPITMDTLGEAKRLFQQGLTNAISNKPKVKQHTAMTTAVINRSKLPNQKFATKVSAIVKQERLHELGSTVAQSGSVSTSNVAFIGQSNDLESRKKRNCTTSIVTLSFDLTHDFLQIGICMRRYPNGVKVCSCDMLQLPLTFS